MDGTSGCIPEFRTKTGVLFAFLMLCRRAHTNVGIMQPPPASGVTQNRPLRVTSKPAIN